MQTALRNTAYRRLLRDAQAAGRADSEVDGHPAIHPGVLWSPLGRPCLEDMEESMVKSAESVVLARTTDEVFRYIADLRNEPAWHVDVDSVPPDTDAVPVVGKTYALKFKPFMGRTDGTFTALEVEPGSRVVYVADFAGLQPRITYTVEPDGEGTRFTRGVEMRPAGLKILMTPMMAFMVPRHNKAFVQNLKRALES